MFVFVITFLGASRWPPQIVIRYPAQMISWGIHIDGRELPGFDPWRDVCGFSDFDEQEYLLPYFDVGDAPIDPYDGTQFSTADTRRLRDRLSSLRGYIEAKPKEWSVTETSASEAKIIHLRQESVLATIDKTLWMCEQAIAKGGGLAFGGD